MSNQVPAVFVAAFDRDVKKDYAQKRQLRNTVTLRTNVQGESYRFQMSGQGLATRKIPQAEVVPMNIGYDKITVILDPYNAPDYSDVYDLQRINFDERQTLVSASADSILRLEDQLVINALNATSNTPIGGTAPITTDTFRLAAEEMDKRNVPYGDNRTFIMYSRGKYQLLGDDDASTVDKNAIKILFKGQIMEWLGFQIYIFGNMAEGGMPDSGTGTNKYAFAYDKKAVGLAIGINMRTSVDWIPDRTSWLINTLYMAASTIIPQASSPTDQFGIVKIEHDLS